MSGETHKLVWFVPEEALDRTRDAVFGAGAGRIGDYERCSWYTRGEGTFLGREGTDETVVPAERARAVVDALVAAHPYEEVAFDLYPLVRLAR